MDLKTAQLIEKLRGNAAFAKNILSSPDGQQLLSLLSGGDGGAALDRAAGQAAEGNPAELAAMLSALMKSPQGAELIRRINETARK